MATAMKTRKPKKSAAANGTNGTADETNRTTFIPTPAKSIDPDTDKLAGRAAELMSLAGDHKRLLILFVLSNGTISVNELCAVVGSSQPATSHHLALLRVSGVIEPERRGKQIFYSLTKRGEILIQAAERLTAE
jgi:ArsR family transcriptional regulator